MRTLYIFLILSMLMAGCGQARLTPEANLPRLVTPSGAPSLTVSSSPTPAPTITPSLTPIPSPTSTPTPVPTLPALPTPEPAPAFIPEAGWTSTNTSPDRRWVVYVYSNKFPAVTRIYRTENGAYWEIISNPYEFYDEHNAPINVYFTPFYWRSDKPYLYLTGQSCCADGLVQYNSGFDLVQLNLATGQSVTYIYGTPTRSAYAFSFSPDDRQMLVYNVKGRQLSVRSMAGYSQKAIALDTSIIQTGAASWAPDGRQVVFQACRSLKVQYIDCGSGLLVLVDLHSLQSRVLVQDVNTIPGRENPFRHPVFNQVTWMDSAHLLVSDSPTADWIVDVPSGRVQPLLPG